MLLTITTTHAPATDLGYLLHKHPERVHEFALSFGTARVVYPEASSERCTAALLVDIDPIALVRDRRGPAGNEGALAQYVNDRPFAASSFLSVAIAQVLGSALGGRSRDRAELAATPIPLEARLPCVPCRGGESVLRRLFEPLGYSVQLENAALDGEFPSWGASRYWSVTLARTCRLSELLNHLYVLIPVLDDDKHYWVADDEVEKLLAHGSGWLAPHPHRELIAERYLKHQRGLTRSAIARLASDDDQDPDEVEAERAVEEAAIERPLSLNEQRLEAVLAVLKRNGAARVLDLGCGEGRLLAALLKDRSFTAIVGLDVSSRALAIAHDRLNLERLPALQRQRITLLHGSLTYRDRRLAGYDAAVSVETIEHLDPHRLQAYTRNLLAYVDAPLTVVTTPNVEFNARFPTLPAGKLRHRDHRFEWTRAQFRAWAEAAAGQHGRSVTFEPIGPLDPELGAPTQMAVFRKSGGA